MKSLFVLALLSIVLTVSFSSVYGYEGKIDVTVGLQNEDYYSGDMIPVNGSIFRADPILGETVQIRILDPDGNVIHTGESPVDSEMFLLEGVEEIWKFEYVVDTNEMKGKIQYTLEAQYDDKVDSYTFSFYMTPEESVIRSGQALKDGKLIINSDEPQPEITESVKDIPSWVKEIAIAWGNGQITDEEFRNAIQYLISVGILQV